MLNQLQLQRKKFFINEIIWKVSSLADPAAGFRGGGGQIGAGSNLGYRKTQNSTDLTHYFF